MGKQKNDKLKQIDEGLKQLRSPLVYEQVVKQFIENSKDSYAKHDKIEVSVEWVKQFVVDFIFWNGQDKQRLLLQGTPIGAVLLEHQNIARFFLDKAGYTTDIDDKGVLTFKKAKDVKQKNSK